MTYHHDEGRREAPCTKKRASGTPILFVHEFGGDHRSWEPQLRYFAGAIAASRYAARGYPPSDVPDDRRAYSQADRRRRTPSRCSTRSRSTRRTSSACRWAASPPCISGSTSPERALSLVVAGAGYGAEKEFEEYFRDVSLRSRRAFRNAGREDFAKIYALGASARAVSEQGSARLAGIRRRARRAFDARRRATRCAACRRAGRRSTTSRTRLKAMNVPTLVMVGDEDDHCLQPGIFLKKTIPACGLCGLPRRPGTR